MTPRLPNEPAEAAAPTALGAFLRGVERRGLVFARLLSGSREAGDQALAWALERFAGDAGKTAFGDWPRRFWSLLLAAPALRRSPAGPQWGAGFEWLSRIGHGPRAALLLRLVAGLAESDAANVLGIARPTYRLGLQRALPHHADGSADLEAWQALGRAAQDMLRALPAGSLAAAVATADGAAASAAPVPAPTGRMPTGRGVRIALGLVALATLAGLVATFVAADRLPAGLDEAPGHILSEPLPAAEPPAGRYADEDALALHPDLGLLLDADQETTASADPAFHAWLVADARAEAEAAAEPGSASVPAWVAVTGTAEPRPRPATDRLAALDPAARARIARRHAEWNALPHAERGERRERWLAWQDLSPAERRQLQQAAAAFAQRSTDEQAALRARFDALDASERRGWLLGPDLGADYTRLHPLIAHVPLDARSALLDALRGLDPQARDDLSVLAARTAPQARAELRIELLATPAAQRGRWLRRSVAPVQ